MISWLLCANAVAAEPFAGWERSRWLIEVEETTPAPIELAASQDFSFRTRALQLQVVLSCLKANAGKKSAEVDCRIESLSVRATPRTMDVPESTNPANAQVLNDMVARLHRTLVRISVTADGRITSVDLPEVQATNRRESDTREILRRLMFDVVAGFHLRRPDAWQGGWSEKHTALLRAPTEPAAIGLSRTEHTVTTVEGNMVIQSTGSGTFTSPYIPWEQAYNGRLSATGSASGTNTGGKGSLGGGAPSLSPSAANDGRMTSAGPSSSATTPTDRTFSGELTSITVFDPATLLPIERVWAMTGRPTASSVGNMQGLSLFYAGRLRRLGANEAVNISMTEIVAFPGQTLEGIGIWEPLNTF